MPFLLQLAESFCTSIPGETAAFCVESAEKTLSTLIGHRDGVIFVSDKGMLGASVQPLLFNNAELRAVEHFMYGDIRLMKAYEEWAKSKGASKINIGNIHGLNHERVGQHYEKRGYVPCEHFYTKEVAA